MTVASNEAPAVALDIELESGDMVRVSGDAVDGSGYSAGPVRGKFGKLDFLDSYSGWLVRTETERYGTYVLAQYLTKVNELDILKERVAELTTQLDATKTNSFAASNELSAFKDSVQEAAADIAEDDDNYRQPLNQLLEAVSLNPLNQEFDITVSFTGSYNITVSGRDVDDAAESIDKESLIEYLRSANLSYVIDDYEVEEA